jgi:dipeptidyl aminopeptidase/acylaminoacyl peptidase
MKSLLFAVLGFTLCLSDPTQAQPRPMQVTDLFAFKRVADPQLSPDGQYVAYQVANVSLADNKSSTNIWLAATDGKTPPKRLTSSAKSDRHPRWSPDGKTILFESNRSGTTQLWTIDITGGEARQLTTISTGAGSALWSPDGKTIAFVSAVYPEFSTKPFAEADELNKKKIADIDASPVKAKVFTRLFFRHWDEYVEDKRGANRRTSLPAIVMPIQLRQPSVPAMISPFHPMARI